MDCGNEGWGTQLLRIYPRRVSIADEVCHTDVHHSLIYNHGKRWKYPKNTTFEEWSCLISDFTAIAKDFHKKAVVKALHNIFDRLAECL